MFSSKTDLFKLILKKSLSSYKDFHCHFIRIGVFLIFFFSFGKDAADHEEILKYVFHLVEIPCI